MSQIDMDMLSEPTVFIVDDEVEVSQGLCRLLKVEGLKAETYNSAQDFLNRYRAKDVGCIVLDIKMPGKSGLDLQKELVEKEIKIPIIFLTGAADVPSAVSALKYGAVDFFEKPVKPVILINSIKKALKTAFKQSIEIKKQSEINSRLALLTPREYQVMLHLVRGATSKEIAENLDISTRTIETHRRRVTHKMQAGSIADLVRMMIKNKC